VLTLALRTDKPLAELYLYDGKTLLVEYTWEAHRELSNTLHAAIDNVLKKAKKSIEDLERVAVYQGPGSFTGLRIGCSVANAIGYSLGIPVVGGGARHETWLDDALGSKVEDFVPVYPVYGSDPHITAPRK